MNNEEKVLQALEKQALMLEQINKTQLQQGMTQAELGAALKSLDKDLAEVSRLSRRTATQTEEIEQLSQRTAVLLETEYRDKLQLLYDGHSLIEEKIDSLSPKSQVDELEDEVDFLRSVVKSMSKRLDALEKAQ